jgi:hypothetical protein
VAVAAIQRDSMTTTTSSEPSPLAIPEDTPEEAALRLLRLSDAVLRMSESEALAAQARASTPEAAPALTERLRSQLSALHAGFGDGTRQRLAPLAVKVDARGANATVDVWCVAVVWTAQYPTYQQWRTVTFELARRDGEWLEVAERTAAGPVPTVLDNAPASDGDVLTRMLSDFADVAAG